ncbi:MAG TPA: hypothetical protein VJ724_10385 [Tahibacter sp.]|nr:hypothetical protein [Tahibacter sp.]
MLSARSRIALLILVAPLALGLMFVGPSRVFGIDTGYANGTLVLALGWATLYGWWRVADEADRLFSRAELYAGIGFTFTLAVAVVFFWKFRALGWDADSFMQSRSSMGRTMVMLLIAWAVFRSVIEHRRGVQVGLDERDRQIAARAQAHSHVALVVFVIALIVHLGVFPERFVSPVTGPNVAHWLIGALILAALAEHVSALVQYRRDRA